MTIYRNIYILARYTYEADGFNYIMSSYLQLTHYYRMNINSNISKYI